jgi:hypothetical protein
VRYLTDLPLTLCLPLFLWVTVPILVLLCPQAEGARAEVRPLGGGLALFIDGQPSNGLMYSTAASKPALVAGGELQLTNSPGYYGKRSTTTTRDFGTDFVLEATATLRQRTGSGCNISLWVNETEQGSYFVSLSEVEGENVITLWKAGRGGWTFDRWISAPDGWTEGQPVRLKLVVARDKLSLHANGTLLGEAVDAEPLPPGPLKISAYHSNSSIDEIRVTRRDGTVVFEDDFSTARPEDWSRLYSADTPTFEQAGLPIAALDIRLAQLWTGPGRYDLAAMDRQVGAVAANRPKSYLLGRLMLNPPKWWLAQHPDDVASYRRLAEPLEGKLQYASFPSPTWREETGQAVREVVGHLMAGENGSRFVGFNMLYAFGPEWEHPCTDAFHDYSPVNVEQFRRWLRQEYGTDEALARAWHQAGAAIEAAEVPPPEDRMRGDFCELMDPARKGQRIADYIRFTDESVVDTISWFAGIIKEETHGNCIVLAHYGYHFEGYDGFDRINYNERGHHAIDRFASLPEIDGTGSAYQYRVRQAGGSAVPITTVASLRLHGKLYWLEDDTRTHLSEPASSYGRTRDMHETLNVLRRNAAYTISEGIPFWYLDFGTDWFSHPQIMAEIGKIVELSDQALQKDRRRNAQIAVIVNQRTVRYLRASTALWLPVLCFEYFEELPRIGAPFDTYLIQDLDRESMPDYKLYILLDTFALNEQERKLVRDKVLTPGHTVLWHYAPGYITEDGLSDQAMSDITGIDLVAMDVGGSLTASLCDLQHPMTRDCPPGLSWGTKLPVGPIIASRDADAAVLGMLHAVPGTNRDGKFRTGDVFEPGLVAKDVNDWTSVWCGVPPVPSALLRNIARAAGVHIYDDASDFVCANNVMVSIHTQYAGPRTIRLPRACTVTDAFTGERVASGVDSFGVQMGQYETRMWWLE